MGHSPLIGRFGAQLALVNRSASVNQPDSMHAVPCRLDVSSLVGRGESVRKPPRFASSCAPRGGVASRAGA